MEKDPRRLDELLDQALQETFPASDPPAVSVSDEPPRQGARIAQVRQEAPRTRGRRVRGRPGKQ
jgi:hypothetical protein